MTIESRTAHSQEDRQEIVPAEELFALAINHIPELIALGRTPQVIVIALEAYILARNPRVRVIRTEDSIAMMVDNKLRRIYYAELANTI